MNAPSRLLATLVVVSGMLLGILAGRVERASAVTYWDYVWVHPGGTLNSGSPNSDYLNCGWHSVCLSPFNWGTGLDWANAHGEYVYYRSYSTNTAGYSWSARALITEWGDTCRVTNVNHYRRSGVHDSTVRYVHTGSNFHLQQFYVSSDLYPQWTSRAVGNTLNEAGLGCATTGPHLHQDTGYGENHWINPATDFPTASSCNTGCGNKNVIDLYQLGYAWQE